MTTQKVAKLTLETKSSLVVATLQAVKSTVDEAIINFVNDNTDTIARSMTPIMSLSSKEPKWFHPTIVKQDFTTEMHAPGKLGTTLKQTVLVSYSGQFHCNQDVLSANLYSHMEALLTNVVSTDMRIKNNETLISFTIQTAI